MTTQLPFLGERTPESLDSIGQRRRPRQQMPEGTAGRNTNPELTQRLKAAASADMEFQPTLPAARHYIENLLSAFGHAICRHDAESLATLVHNVNVRITMGSGLRTVPEAGQIIDWFQPNNRMTIQTISNLRVHFAERLVLYTAIYQTWNIGAAPRCIAVGTYHGHLRAGPQVWRWEEHVMSAPSEGSD